MPNAQLSVFQGANLLLSALLGSSVLIIPALAASEAGLYSLVGWLIIIAVMIPVVFTFSGLGRRYPHEGGTAHYVAHAFGPSHSKAIAWLYLAIAPIGPPVVFITGASYFSQIFGGLTLPALTLELAMLALVTLMNFVKLKTSAKLQSLISWALVVAIILVSISSLFYQDATIQAPIVPFEIGHLGAAIAIMFWSFVGIEAICHVANEFKDPSRDFPKAVFIGVGAAAALYIVISYAVVVHGAYGSESKNLNSITHIAEIGLGVFGQRLVAILGFLGCFAAVNLYLMSFVRMLYSLFEGKGNQHPLRKKSSLGIPVAALFLVSLSIALVLITRNNLQFSFESLLAIANAMFVVIYLAASLAGIKLLTGSVRIAAIAAAIFCAIILYFTGVSGLQALGIYLVFFILDHLSNAFNRTKPKSSHSI
ncbi:L-methionine/branched-chain amino acid transporter [Alginatibacterium sediminis]|uniref:L-methionine/branched-chain amino acid transporter n=1 Tax=Alginatibacterium sediminis TaxID=2164068 RepID=A0A420ELG8_9ALTE|nr:L-methionine/branched-chain amino acid transporter [Alginatibacterium sediminis]RKF21557.1 L-methionine/branched-chain amino acid transporter [Alginatibacterium sediminis]